MLADDGNRDKISKQATFQKAKSRVNCIGLRKRDFTYGLINRFSV
ncbi:hypothetical protein GPDM_06063 [Planococcus donghaensis MPA1U2]|uniref:Uncharacterized protein n=1 Tax=Planococcus donghaensis MPA1U2 TaxID=933115 RepID=E7RFG9_9BACL|nr:hypothetical protein GPDM_06063 [Planococcus donghaensis MPA1U2]